MNNRANNVNNIANNRANNSLLGAGEIAGGRVSRWIIFFFAGLPAWSIDRSNLHISTHIHTRTHARTHTYANTNASYLLMQSFFVFHLVIYK